MRYLAFLVALVMTLPAFAQNSDWKKLGRPLDDDTKPMVDRYVYFNTDAMDHGISTAQPVLPQQEVEQWVKNQLGTIMTLDGARYDQMTLANRKFFTPSGYADYILYLKNVDMGTFLKNDHFKVVAYVEDRPQLTAQGLRKPQEPQQGGQSVYVWQGNVTMTLSYFDYKNQAPAGMFQEKNPSKIINRFPLDVSFELVRIPRQEDGTLVAINRIRFSTPAAATP